MKQHGSALPLQQPKDTVLSDAASDVLPDAGSGSAIDVVDPLHAVAASAPPAKIISRQRCSQPMDHAKASFVPLRCAGIHGPRVCRSVPRSDSRVVNEKLPTTIGVGMEARAQR